MARKTGYTPEHAKKAYRLTLLGLKDKQLASALDISEATLNNWKKKHSEFLESIKEGKENADAKVANALYEKACGLVTTEERVIDGEVVELEKKHPPDTAAAFIWLKNRQPRIWRDKVEMQVDDKRIDRQKKAEELQGEITELETLREKLAANG